MNIYKLIYFISKKKTQFFLIILIAGFLGINANKFIETKYFFTVKLKFSLNLDDKSDDLNSTIGILRDDFINQLKLKDNYIFTLKNKNFYEIKIYLKNNNNMEYEKESQEIIKLTNEYTKKYNEYLSNLRENKESLINNKKDELKMIEEFMKFNKNYEGDKLIEKIYNLKQSIISLNNAISFTVKINPIQLFIEELISVEKIKINKYAMAVLMIIFSMVMYVTFIIIYEEYKKEIKKFK